MPTPAHESYVRQCLDHIRALTVDIGPRGSVTAGERRGAEYCRSIFQSLGLTPRVEIFASARSIYYPQMLTGLAMLLAFLIYVIDDPTGPWVAALLVLLAFVSQSQELAFRDNFYRWLLPTAPSQNVVATLPPRGQHRQDLVLIGHIDTNRTPIIFSSDRWVDAFRIFLSLSFFGLVAQVVGYFLGAWTHWPWVWPASIPCALLGLGLIGLALQAESTPFTTGANDNATAVGTVLSLAHQLRDEPLEHTRLWLVCTGCEEVKHYGAADFFKRHRAEMRDPKALIFEMLGCDGPAYLLREGMRPFSFRAHPRMVRLAAQVAQANPRWGAHPTRVDLGYTEMADALLAGIPAITFIGLGAERMPIGYRGKPLYWHRRDDTFDKIEPEVLARAYGYTLDFIRTLDRQCVDSSPAAKIG